MKKYIIAYALILFTPILVFAYVSPGKPTGMVSDFANVISESSRRDIESKLLSLKDSGVAQIAVVTIPTLGDETRDTYATKLFDEWKIGEKGKDNGILILIAINDGEARIEVGYGLEGVVTDLQATNIVKQVMFPAFRSGDFSLGVSSAVDALSQVISGSPEAALYSVPESTSKINSTGLRNYGEYIIFLVLFGLSALGQFLSKSKSWWLGGVIGAGAGLVIGLIWGFVEYGIASMIILGILGLIFDYIMSTKFPGGKGGSGASGIFFGGGSSSFGGGSSFGGFGGGMSGGGGGGGKW